MGIAQAAYACCYQSTLYLLHAVVSLRKHAYSSILNISPPKTESFQIKFLIFFIFLLKTKRGGSNEYPQSMFLSRNKKNSVYLCKPQFYHIKVGFKGSQNYIGMFS